MKNYGVPREAIIGVAIAHDERGARMAFAELGSGRRMTVFKDQFQSPDMAENLSRWLTLNSSVVRGITRNIATFMLFRVQNFPRVTFTPEVDLTSFAEGVLGSDTYWKYFVTSVNNASSLEEQAEWIARLYEKLCVIREGMPNPDAKDLLNAITKPQRRSPELTS